MHHVYSVQRAATLGRKALTSLVLVGLALAALVASPSAGAAQVGDPVVIFTIDDYQLEPGPDPIDVLLHVDPLEQLDTFGVGGFGLVISYDPAVIQPAGSGVPECQALVALVVSCGPPDPSGQLLINGFTTAVPGLTEAGDYVRIPFVAVAPGQSDLAITITEVVDGSARLVEGAAVSGSVTVSEPATCLGQLVTINMNTGAAGIGTQGNDVILGTPGDDVIRGLGGDDVICGGPGDDELFGNFGNDVINGGAGDDLVIGNAGDDSVRGGQGNDIVRGSIGDDQVFGNAGDDTLQGGEGNDIMRGDAGADDVRGGPGNDRLRGGDQNDLLRGDRGNDYLNGGQGIDEMRGGADVDRCIIDASGDATFGCEL